MLAPDTARAQTPTAALTPTPELTPTPTLTLTPSPTPKASPAPTPIPPPPQGQAPAPLPAASSAATAASRSVEGGFLKTFLRDQKAIWTSPAYLRTSDIWWVGSLAGATSALIATDRRTGDEVAEKSQLVAPSVAISYAGSGYTVAAAAASFYLIGRATHNDRAMETGMLSGEAFLNSAIVTLSIKAVTQRARPQAGDERGEFFVGGTSFSSGHASNIWSIATVVASEYHDRPIVPIAAYGLASLVSVARFTAQRHYLSDVLVGSAVGFGIGRYVYRVHHVDLSRSGGSASAVDRGGAGKRPLISSELSRRANAYSLRLTWIY